jgi:hypothetical protein
MIPPKKPPQNLWWLFLLKKMMLLQELLKEYDVRHIRGGIAQQYINTTS